MVRSNYNPMSEADVVFRGVAIKTSKRIGDYSVTVFKVSEKQKGLIIGKEVSVKHRTEQNFCKLPIFYKPNQEYVVYAQRNLLGRLYIKQRP